MPAFLSLLNSETTIYAGRGIPQNALASSIERRGLRIADTIKIYAQKCLQTPADFIQPESANYVFFSLLPFAQLIVPDCSRRFHIGTLRTKGTQEHTMRYTPANLIFSCKAFYQFTCLSKYYL